ncbi:MAG: helix-turn-helix transcriptional regulator [Aquaticitalea sp.]
MDSEIFINYPIGEKTAEHLVSFFDGTLERKYGEYKLFFDNDFGSGIISILPCGAGLCYMHFDVKFLVNISFNIVYSDVVPVDFLFLTSGDMTFRADSHKPLTIESYQNAIVRYQANVPVNYQMTSKQAIKLNIIQICPKPYLDRNHHYVELLEHNFKDMFIHRDATRFYHHFGNFNLKIADFIRELNHCPHEAMIRALMREGYVNMILALQLAEYENYNNNNQLPESLSKEDVKKINEASELIKNQINQNLSVRSIASMVSMTESKLQLGFKFVFHKTVNNYIKEIKLQAAHLYLLEMDMTVSEVVYKVGYSSRSYFTQIFFERFGILPNEFKKSSK